MTKDRRFVFAVVALALLGSVALLITLGAVLPRRWKVSQVLLINAEQSRIHRFVADLRSFPEWAQAPNAPRNNVTLQGSPSEVGSTLSWSQTDSGASQEGRFMVTIEAASPTRGVQWTAWTPDGSRSFMEVTYAPVAGATQVTWTDQGELSWWLGGLFLALHSERLEAHMERGLSRLAELVTAPPSGTTPPPAATP